MRRLGSIDLRHPMLVSYTQVYETRWSDDCLISYTQVYETRWSDDCLIFKRGIPISGKTVFILVFCHPSIFLLQVWQDVLLAGPHRTNDCWCLADANYEEDRRDWSAGFSQLVATEMRLTCIGGQYLPDPSCRLTHAPPDPF